MGQTWVWAPVRHTSSHSPLSGTLVTSGTEGKIRKLFQTASVFCRAGRSLMLSRTWLDADLCAYLSRPCQEGKLACHSKLG